MTPKKGNRHRFDPVPQNQKDALTLALKLGLTATSEKRMKMAVQLAEDLSAGLCELDIIRCKKRALNELGISQ